MSPETGAEVQLVAEDATAPVSPNASVLVEDVDAAFEEAQRLGVEIVHPLIREPWGVRRFFVRGPRRQRAQRRPPPGVIDGV